MDFDILDVSRTGLFLQTDAAIDAVTQVDVELSPGAQSEVIPLQASVVWKRVIPPKLRRVASGGLGMQILWAPEPYYQLLASLMKDPETLRTPSRRT